MPVACTATVRAAKTPALRNTEIICAGFQLLRTSLSVPQRYGQPSREARKDVLPSPPPRWCSALFSSSLCYSFGRGLAGVLYRDGGLLAAFLGVFHRDLGALFKIGRA